MRILAALSLAALAAGCNLTNDTVLVATLMQSPAPPTGYSGAQVTVAQLYLGQTSVTSPSAGDVKPISGATVQIYDNGALVPVSFSESQPGYYTAGGAPADNFYQATHTYRFVARVGSDEYWGEVQSVPGAPALTLPGTAAGDIYTYASYDGTAQFSNPYPLQRACASAICDVAFYGVWSVSVGGTFDGSATPNCSNAPADAAALLSFAFLDDTAWRVPTFNVDKVACFPQPSAYPGGYVVGLTALKKGTTSGNTSIASAALAGTSDAAGVIVSAP